MLSVDGRSTLPSTVGVSAAEVAMALGGATRAGSQWLARCPAHSDKRPSLALRDGDEGRLLVHCFAGCEARFVLEELHYRGLFDWQPDPACRRRTQRPRSYDDGDAKRFELARHLWDAAVDPAGTIAEVYLQKRGLFLPADVKCLRFHPRCPRGADRLPALIAAMMSTVGNELRAVHRIFLRPDGSDRLRDPLGKMTLGMARDTAIKLVADDDVTRGLGLCEGIEDGLAIIAAGWRPVWATTAGGIARFEVLSGIESLTVFADSDAPGRAAALKCAERWQAAGREALVVEPLGGIKDHNDLVKQARHG
jgi:putative DNA primase/helicase